jgi:membrane associated rhomboid family serine protease
MNIWDDIKMTFKHGSVITRIIYVNLAIFLMVRIVYVFFFLFKVDYDLLQWLALPASVPTLLTRPWTLVTYMFLHFDFLHILFNLLWLYWFGKIFLNYFEEQKLLGTYLLGGLMGGLVYVLAFNFIPAFEEAAVNSILLGASASILAIVVSVAFYVPNLQVNLLLISSMFGPIKIIWIALISLVIYFLGISGSNAGGNLAHLGGAFWGLLYISQLKRGRDLASGLNRILFSMGNLFVRKKKLRVAYRKSDVRSMSDHEYNVRKKQEKESVNAILDKIGKSGYDSLSKREKEILFNASNNKRNSKDLN